MKNTILILLIVQSLTLNAQTSDQEKMIADFTQLIYQHQSLFNLLPHPQSGLSTITTLPDHEHVDADPGYLLETKNLLIGPLAKCDRQQELDFSPIHLHEYAHTVFTENFYQAFSLSGESPIEERYNPSKSSLNDKKSELNKLVTLRDLIEPFDEVFADTFAALALDNPSALHQVLVACGTKDVARDFSAQYPIEGWNQGTLKPTLLAYSFNHYSSSTSGQNSSLFLDAKVHNILSPFRSHIWSEYLKQKHKAGVKNQIVRWVYLTSINITRKLHNSKIKYQDWFSISKEELNRQAILEFDRLIKFEL